MFSMDQNSSSDTKQYSHHLEFYIVFILAAISLTTLNFINLKVSPHDNPKALAHFKYGLIQNDLNFLHIFQV